MSIRAGITAACFHPHFPRVAWKKLRIFFKFSAPESARLELDLTRDKWNSAFKRPSPLSTSLFLCPRAAGNRNKRGGNVRARARVCVCAGALKRGLTCMIADDCVPSLKWLRTLVMKIFCSYLYIYFFILGGCWGRGGGGGGARSPSVQDTSPYGAAVLSHTESKSASGRCRGRAPTCLSQLF